MATVVDCGTPSDFAQGIGTHAVESGHAWSLGASHSHREGFVVDHKRIGKRNKTSGTHAEYRARDWLRAVGFYVVRAAGSHGLFDLVAFNAHSLRLVAVRSGDARLTEHEQRAMLDVPAPPNATREYWRVPKGARTPIIEFLT